MNNKINSLISVELVFTSKDRRVFPRKLMWNDRVYQVQKIGLHHSYRVGKTLFHVFSVETESLFLRLVLNTENLNWTLEEISDGEPS